MMKAKPSIGVKSSATWKKKIRRARGCHHFLFGTEFRTFGQILIAFT